MLIADPNDHGRREDPRRRPWAWLIGALTAIVVVAVAVLALLGEGYGTLQRWTVDPAGTRWVAGMADGLPYRHPRHVRPNGLVDWSPAPIDRIQVYSGFQVASENPSAMTLFLPFVDGEPEPFVNGVPINAADPAGPRYSTHPTSRSAIWDIPASFLRPGPNRIDVLISRPGRRSLTAPIVLGPLDAPAAFNRTLSGLTERFRRHMPFLSFVAAGFALAAGAALRTPGPWIALAAAAAAVGARTLLSEEVIQSELGAFWPLLDQVALTAGLICLGCVFLDPGTPRSARDRRSLGAGFVFCIALGGVSAWGAHEGARGPETAGLALPLLGTAFLVWACIDALRQRAVRSVRAQAVEGWILGMLALATIPPVTVGSGMAWGLWVLGLEAAHILSVSGLLGGLAALSAFVASLEVWRRARDRPRLSTIIRSQQEEIEATSLALQQQLKRSAVLEERQRLSRDMHDGIGGQLISLLARVRSRRISPDQLEGELVSGLSELRLMVDSLDASGGSVADALAVLRSRIRIQTEAAQMTLEWSQAGNQNIVVDDPRWILNLNRLIQEAVTNAVRHSGGDGIKVHIEATGGGQLRVTIEDNGIGLDPENVPRGRGLSNLAFRAAQLGGRLEIGRGGSSGGAKVSADIRIPPMPTGDVPGISPAAI